MTNLCPCNKQKMIIDIPSLQESISLSTLTRWLFSTNSNAGMETEAVNLDNNMEATIKNGIWPRGKESEFKVTR